MSDNIMNQMLATRRYGATQQTRSLRDQEADVFRRVNYGLKAAMNGDRIERARAVADNRRLWMAVEAAMMHPANQLPKALKVSILSLGRLIQRETDTQTPDIQFLINMNDQMIAGLSGDPG
jgi:flagellar biosynthesis regulator FlaF